MMKTKWWRDEFKVGLMFIVGIALLGIMLFRASQCRVTSGDREAKVQFGYVGGLLKKAPVHMHGIEIGRVKSVELMGNKVEVIISLRKTEPIREGYRIYIDILGLVGEKYIEILNGPIENPPSKDDPLIGLDPISVGHVMVRTEEIADKTLKTIDFIQEFVEINGKKVQTGAGDLRDFAIETREMLRKTLNNMDSLMTNINCLTETAEADIGETITNLKTLTQGLNSDREKVSSLIENTTGKLDTLITNSSSAVDESVENFQKLSVDLRDSTAKASQIISGLSESLSSLIAQLKDATGSGTNKIQKGLDEIDKSAKLLNSTIMRIDRLLSKIENGEGTLGKFVSEDTGYQQFNSAINAGKQTVNEINSVVSNVNRKLQFFDEFGNTREYGIDYDHQSQTLEAQFKLSLFRISPYYYLAGLSMREDNLNYDLQIGRRFGPLIARAGAISSKAGVGIDYWPISRRLGFSLEGTDITEKRPRLDMDVAIRMLGDWYFSLGTEDFTSSDRSFKFGIKAISGDNPTE